MCLNWNAIAAISTMIAAIAAAATAIIAYFQTRQTSTLARNTAAQAMELAKFNAEFQAVQHLDVQWQSNHMIKIRRSAAKVLLRNTTNFDVDQVLDFFEEIARLTKRGVLSIETAWDAYYWRISNYWAVCAAYAERVRQDEGASWTNLPELVKQMRELEAKTIDRSINSIAPSEEETKEFLRDESVLKLS